MQTWWLCKRLWWERYHGSEILCGNSFDRNFAELLRALLAVISEGLHTVWDTRSLRNQPGCNKSMGVIQRIGNYRMNWTWIRYWYLQCFMVFHSLPSLFLFCIVISFPTFLCPSVFSTARSIESQFGLLWLAVFEKLG